METHKRCCNECGGNGACSFGPNAQMGKVLSHRANRAKGENATHTQTPINVKCVCACVWVFVCLFVYTFGNRRRVAPPIADTHTHTHCSLLIYANHLFITEFVKLRQHALRVNKGTVVCEALTLTRPQWRLYERERDRQHTHTHAHPRTRDLQHSWCKVPHSEVFFTVMRVRTRAAGAQSVGRRTHSVFGACAQRFA